MDLKTTAYHESGHAVANYLLHIGNIMVTIVPSEEYFGLCKSNFYRDDFQPDIYATELEAALTIARRTISRCAGAVAEELLNGSHGDGCEEDMHYAVDLADYVVGSNEMLEKYMEKAFNKAKHILQSHWRQIEVLAGELLEKKELKGEQIEEILLQATQQSQKTFPKKG